MSRADRGDTRPAVTPEDRELRQNGRTGRPVHLRFRYGSVVFAGGVLGTLARYGLDTVMPSPQGWPLPTLLINLTGAFLLGVVLEALLRRGADTGHRRLIRLGIGTGFLGAFTTYSTLAVEAVTLGAAANLPGALLYLSASLFGGVLASLLGVWTASIHHRSGTSRDPQLKPEGQ